MKQDVKGNLLTRCWNAGRRERRYWVLQGGGMVDRSVRDKEGSVIVLQGWGRGYRSVVVLQGRVTG